MSFIVVRPKRPLKNPKNYIFDRDPDRSGSEKA